MGAIQNIIKEVESVKESTRGTRYDKNGLELATRIRYLAEEGHDGDSLGDLLEDIRVIEDLPGSNETKSPSTGSVEMIFEAKLKGGKRAELRIHSDGSGFIGMLCHSGRWRIVLHSETPIERWNAAKTVVSVLEETYGDELKRIVMVENDEDDELGRDIEIKVADDDGGDE